MRIAFKTEEEAEHAFGIFDKDFNGDISMEEMECVCNEIHLERKAIAASLKDLDSVIQKLDKPVHHAFAKELLAGFAGAEVDKLVETKGLDYIDREKAKRHAEKQAESLYDNQYGDLEQYDP
ncbi:hypothetical protein BN1708_018238, partial [Verticillium longisporum]